MPTHIHRPTVSALPTFLTLIDTVLASFACKSQSLTLVDITLALADKNVIVLLLLWTKPKQASPPRLAADWLASPTVQPVSKMILLAFNAV